MVKVASDKPTMLRRPLNSPGRYTIKAVTNLCGIAVNAPPQTCVLRLKSIRINKTEPAWQQVDSIVAVRSVRETLPHPWGVSAAHAARHRHWHRHLRIVPIWRPVPASCPVTAPMLPRKRRNGVDRTHIVPELILAKQSRVFFKHGTLTSFCGSIWNRKIRTYMPRHLRMIPRHLTIIASHLQSPSLNLPSSYSGRGGLVIGGKANLVTTRNAGVTTHQSH